MLPDERQSWIRTSCDLAYQREFPKAVRAITGGRKASGAPSVSNLPAGPLPPGLRFKPVHPRDPIYSVRVGLHYRAVGVKDGDEIVWFWIGAHAEYDRLLKQRGRKA